MTAYNALRHRKVMFTLPPDLLARLDGAAEGLGITRSELIRRAVDLYIDGMRKLELRESMAEGYKVHAQRDREISAAFDYADFEATGADVQDRGDSVVDTW